MTNDDAVAGIQFDLLYPQVLTLSDLDGDPTTLDAVDVEVYAAILEAVSSSTIDDDGDGIPDRLRVLIYSLSGNTITSGSGSIVKLYVNVAIDAESGTYPLTLDGVVLASSKGTALPVTFDVQDLVIGFHDEDQDCYLVPEDCDDNDDTVYPGAPEIAYDGIDQDCDGEDLIDVDEDGYDGEQVGGDDCDDEDPSIHPDAKEIPNDAIDQDCDGTDLETTTSTTTSSKQPVDSGLDTGQDLSEGGDSDQVCGCAATTPLGPSALALLLLFASRRRQQDAING
jgi:hypothetical protein